MTRRRSFLGDALRLMVAGVFLVPLLLAFISAFRPDQEMFRYSARLSIYTFFPYEPTLDNIQEMLVRPYFMQQLVNTLFVGVVQSTLTVLVAAIAAFPLARMHFRSREIIFFAILATMFVPFEALVVPLFLINKSMRMLNNFWGLMLPWIASPVAIFLLRQAMQEIPQELDEAAIMDGARVWHLFYNVVVPNIKPAMVTVWIVTFMYVWDSFLWPLVIMTEPSRQMVQIGIASLFNPERIRFGNVFAGSVIAVGPVLVLFILLQRYYQRGIALTGMK